MTQVEPEKRPNPYRWQGHALMHTGDDVVVATTDDFPELARALRLRQRVKARIAGAPVPDDA